MQLNLEVTTMRDNYHELMNNLQELGLNNMCNYLPEYLDETGHKTVPLTESLLKLTDEEIHANERKHIDSIIKKARFPVKKSIEEFDFGFQTSINEVQIREFQNMGFMERHDNLIFLGSPGVGKTHLATAIGVSACRQDIRTLFINCNDLLLKLKKAYDKGTLDRQIRRYSNYELLIIDELGYLPIEKQEANLLFQLINNRYERHSTIITSNASLSSWGDILQDTVTASAILDRLVHHAQIIKITGKSYRLRNNDLIKK